MKFKEKGYKRQQYHKEYSERPEIKKRRKELHIERTYNIGIDKYYKILKDQNNLCAICNENIRLCVDHCHDTGKIRGLLCNGCNTGLGGFKDNINNLKSAIKYLSTVSS